MASTSFNLFLFVFLLLFSTVTASPSNSQPCDLYKFPNNIKYAACIDLAVLDSTIFWNYHPSSNTVDIAFKKKDAQQSNWIAWAINPTSNGMKGSQALIAYQKSDGTLSAYTSPITSYQTRLQEGNLSFPVYGVSAIYTNDDLIIFATINLPSNSTVMNHVWQEGSVFGDGTLGMHALSGPNIQSFLTLDFVSGKVSAESSGRSRNKLRNIHGILNGISWGILMPLGAIIARYAKMYNNRGAAWFYAHLTCQCLGYLIGVGGFAIGSHLGNSYGVHQNITAHGVIGIVLFCLATIQILGGFARPEKDHKNRIIWDIYHHISGYGIIALSIVNIFKGFSLMQSYSDWKKAYFGIIVSLGILALILEFIARVMIYWKKKNSTNSQVEAGISL